MDAEDSTEKETSMYRRRRLREYRCLVTTVGMNGKDGSKGRLAFDQEEDIGGSKEDIKHNECREHSIVMFLWYCRESMKKVIHEKEVGEDVKWRIRGR